MPATKTAAAKPFLKWAGGKRRLLPALREAAADAGPFDNYIEPFLGGGALLLDVISGDRRPARAAAGDVNARLVLAWSAVRDNPDGLLDLLRGYERAYLVAARGSHAKAYYESRRDEANALAKSGPKGADALRLAALTIFLNRTCFNGLYRENRDGEFNVPFGRYAAPRIADGDGIAACSKALRGVELACFGFRDTLERAGYGPGTLAYLDPPYRPAPGSQAFTAYAAGGFADGDQADLASACRALDAAGAAFMLSNSDTGDGFFEDLYKGFRIRYLDAPRSISADGARRGSAREILVTNF